MPKHKITQATALIIVATIGLAGSIITGHYLVQANTRPVQIIIEATQTAEGKQPNRLDLKRDSGSQWYKQGQMIVLATDDGAAAIRFESGSPRIPQHKCTSKGSICDALYEWRYRKYGSNLVQTGSGILYENYESTPVVGGARVVDVGSKLAIEIENISLRWSAGSNSNLPGGWIYYNNLGIGVLDDTLFDSFDLSTIHLAN